MAFSPCIRLARFDLTTSAKLFLQDPGPNAHTATTMHKEVLTLPKSKIGVPKYRGQNP